MFSHLLVISFYTVGLVQAVLFSVIVPGFRNENLLSGNKRKNALNLEIHRTTTRKRRSSMNIASYDYEIMSKSSKEWINTKVSFFFFRVISDDNNEQDVRAGRQQALTCSASSCSKKLYFLGMFLLPM